MLQLTLQHLKTLVSHDTRNPPRLIGTDGLIGYLHDALQGFERVVTDHGAGSVSLFARRGDPDVVFNFHMDTVPDSPAWTRNPFELHVADGRAYGLGACDIKGAAAAMLAAAAQTPGDVALLFTTDEEANDPRGIAAFLGEDHGFGKAVIAEPTRAQAVLAHRGIAAVDMRFTGRAGHSSARNWQTDSALHRAVRWGGRALDLAASLDSDAFGGLSGFRFNIGRIEGGIKANIIAPEAYLRFGFRPLPSQSIDALLVAFRDLAGADEIAHFAETFRGPPLPAAAGEVADAQLAAGRALAESLGLPIGEPVDFWTEASLFSDAGLDALVFGPGDIAQAHTADEWVSLDELEAVAGHYARILSQ
ncbi:MAG TPA: acetylornithine deacetylase [Xanthomonadaceae bacterium]|nr:acetylornithine deacetylase [Xanthomonadaceae bacterium]